MNSSGRKAWLLVGGVVLAGLALLAIILIPRLNNRQAAATEPVAGLPSLTPALSPDAASSPEASSPASTAIEAGDEQRTPATEAFTATAELAETGSTATPQPLCGGPPAMNILAIGIDSGADYRYGLADVIRIVKVDFVTPKVSVFSLPRDIWVEIPGIEDHNGITHGKLNQAYFYGSPGMGYYDGPGGGAGLLAETLELNFGIQVDNYGVVNMGDFVRIVDAVGGVDVYLPEAVNGRPTAWFPHDMGFFPAGENHLNGEQALRLSRIRHTGSDLARAENQNRVICGLKEKIASPEIIPKIPEIIASFRDSVLTNFSQKQLEQLACLAPEIKPENLVFAGLPPEILSSGRVYSPQFQNETFVWDVDLDVIADYAGQFMAGTWPEETDEPFCP